MRRLLALAAVFVSGFAVAACRDVNKSNNGPEIGTTATANPSTLTGTGEDTTPQTTP